MIRFIPRIALLVGLYLAVAFPAWARGSRIVDDSDRLTLFGNVHPHARPQFETGATDPLLPMEHMVLSLRLAAEKQAAVQQLIVEQQDPASANYHKWLSPEEFGGRFGPSPEDIATVTDWLTSQGFTVDELAKGRTWVNFSGKVIDMERSFRTKMRNYNVKGRLHHANAQNPSIPRGFSDLIAGVSTLHNFPRRHMNKSIRTLDGPLNSDYTSASGNHSLAPGDFAAIYNLNPLYSAGIDGTGQAIAIVGRTHPSTTNWSTFRTTFGLSANPPQVIVNGTDPGDLGADEDGEADLDVEWSGAVAKNAAIKFVISKSTASTDGIDLSAQYIVNNNLAPVMSVSFGSCEAQMGKAENAFFNNLWAQAAAQGITVFVSTGDSGAAGCDDPASTTGTGKGVSGVASTPYNVAVGGTQFNEGSGSYWNASNGSNGISVNDYIPEVAWNESSSASYCPADVAPCTGLWATSGGVSSIYAKPAWQTGLGVPADGKRDLPDVSLTAGSHDGYRVRSQSAWYLFSGTSTSSPAFAGIMALILQKTGQRQGNANTRFYQLATAQNAPGGPAVYHDITSGNNSVPGVTGYSAATGYDLATGLGSVDATQLVNNWVAALPGAPVNGTCGTSNGGTFTIIPATNLCSAGTATTVTGIGPWNWSCTGANGGGTASCSAAIQSYTITFTSGGNGTLTGTASQTVNYGGSATTVIAVPAAGYHFVNWTGTGGFVTTTTNPLTVTNVTAVMTITANFSADPVNGACGTSNGGTFTITPTTNLCSTGTATTVTGNGPWNWSCTGANGGSTSGCSAAIQSYTITFTSGGNGTLTGTVSQTVNYGGSASTVTAVPASDYHFVNWTEGATVIGTTAALTIGNITSTHNYEANFAADPVDGICGTSNGNNFTVAPTTNLCSPAAAVALATSATGWTWTCSGTNGGANATCSATIDITGPILTVSTLADGAITNNATLNISGTVSDTSGVAGLTINNATVTVTDGSFSTAVTLQAGANTITTIATDTLGNQTTDTRTITLDQTAPVLTILSPADNSKTAQPLATITGTISETSTVTVTLNNGTKQNAAITGSAYSATVSLASGLNSISITATDLAGNTTSIVRSVTYDNTNPSLAITNPNQDITTTQNSITISGTVSDTITSTTISISFNGQTLTPTVTSGVFSQQLVLPGEGTWPILVTATDEAGNTATATRNIIYAIPVNGICGTSSGGTFAAIPAINLCSIGSAGSVTGTSPYNWSCAGSNGGTTASCSANTTSFTITPTTGSGYTIAPSTSRTVNVYGTAAFTVTPSAGYGIVSVSGCSGSLSGSTYTTGPVTANCTVSIAAVARNANGNGSAEPPTISDALKVLQAVAGKTELTAAEQIRYDVAPLGSDGTPLGNGVIDAADLILILRRSIGIGNW